MALQEKTAEFVLGFSMEPDKLYSFLLDAIESSPNLRVACEDRTALKARFAWMNRRSEEYNFDFAISFEGNLLSDIHFLPVSPADSSKLSQAVAIVIKAISSDRNLPIIELNEYTMLTEEPSSADVEKIATYLEENGIATLDSISDALGFSESTVASGLHRLIDNGVVGSSPPGSIPKRVYFRQQAAIRRSGLFAASAV
jgi:hypothetical protein